jgi:hypothetical protein
VVGSSVICVPALLLVVESVTRVPCSLVLGSGSVALVLYAGVLDWCVEAPSVDSVSLLRLGPVAVEGSPALDDGVPCEVPASAPPSAPEMTSGPVSSPQPMVVKDEKATSTITDPMVCVCTCMMLTPFMCEPRCLA